VAGAKAGLYRKAGLVFAEIDGWPVTVTSAVADFLVSARLVAFTDTPPFGTTAGAVYKPELLIVPSVALPLTTLFTVQTTVVFSDPVTVAVNRCVAPTWIFADVGETSMETPGVEGVTATVAVAMKVHNKNKARCSRNSFPPRCGRLSPLFAPANAMPRNV
jgi:hypothetical protein